MGLRFSPLLSGPSGVAFPDLSSAIDCTTALMTFPVGTGAGQLGRVPETTCADLMVMRFLHSKGLDAERPARCLCAVFPARRQAGSSGADDHQSGQGLGDAAGPKRVDDLCRAGGKAPFPAHKVQPVLLKSRAFPAKRSPLSVHLRSAILLCFIDFRQFVFLSFLCGRLVLNVLNN